MSKNVDNKKSFVMYDSFLEAMKHLNDAEFRECVLKIRDYALEGVEEESTSPMVNIILAMARPNLDAARRRYETSVENGKKGAEYGKLGGAPKGNQNARKKQPLNQPQKQPLNVDVEENVNENEEVDVNEDTPVEDIIHSSFSNSSNRVLSKEIENDSERLEEREERRTPLKAGKKGGNPQYSKTNSNNTVPVSPGSGRGTANSTARPRRRTVKGGEYDQSEYYSLCLNNYVLDLADMRLGILPNEDSLFWQAVDLYKVLYGKSNDEAIKTISSTVNEIVQQKK
jgi:hypothetical protein